MSVSREALPNGSDGAQAIRTLLLLPVRSLQTERGRRLAGAIGLALALQGVVGMMFANPDLPTGAAEPAAAVTKVQAAAPALGAAAAAARPLPAPAQAAKPATDYAQPRDAAIAWFARKAGVPVDKVRAQQQVAAGDNKVKILVMAENGDRIDTDEVTVTRTRTGWRVR
jgi:hypothetical protein